MIPFDRIKPDGKVTVWDRGPARGTEEYAEWVRQYLVSSRAIEFDPIDAAHAMQVEPARYSLERI